ncbi:glyoxalase [Streptomyces sp. RKND-216]|uniref:VOC family protein n=1 Tax=Streptomyces sp. RKND-216 TaxID=2562581 RepID=UPI00109DD3B4|nr:VOC family protein [Streptomyces sp. RKND-216]THA26565.1 glyoxalase [Streptomyces sp. RKND-216]
MAPRFGLIGIVTADMAASLAFYRRLGLDIPAGADTEAHVEAVLPGGLRMAWDSDDTVASFDPGWPRPTRAEVNGRISLAFLCDGPAGVDEVYAGLTAAGHPGHKEPWDAFWGQRYAVVEDPDGNTVDLFAPLSDAPAGG